MDGEIKVSVIIPVFNAEKYLRECINSVVDQTLEGIEIICVDDGSTDGSCAVLEEYASRYPGIKLLHQENSGSGPARNLGIMAARGEYIAFMDADDYYPDEAVLEKLYAAAKKQQTRICGGSFSVVWPNGRHVTRFRPKRLWGYTFDQDRNWQYREYQFDFGYHRFIYQREFLLGNKLFFPPYLRFQDPPFFVRSMIAAGSFYALRDVTYCYRMGTGPRGIASSRLKALGLIEGYADDLEMARDNSLWDLYRLTFERCYKDDWNVVMAADQYHDSQLDAALKRLDQAVDLSLLSDIGRFCRWRYQKDRKARECGENLKSSSIWSVRALSETVQTAWSAFRSLRENGLTYFVLRLRVQLFFIKEERHR